MKDNLMHRQYIQNIYSLPDIRAVENFNNRNNFYLGTSKFLASLARPMESETLAMTPVICFSKLSR